jgi:hypothetical protein
VRFVAVIVISAICFSLYLNRQFADFVIIATSDESQAVDYGFLIPRRNEWLGYLTFLKKRNYLGVAIEEAGD